MIVQTSLKLIAERSAGQWLVWFEKIPHVTFSGRLPADAIMQLLTHFGGHNYDIGSTSMDKENSTGSHLEFTIPMRRRRRIPVASLN